MLGYKNNPFILERFMSSATVTTLMKMVESLPEELQEKIVEHVRDYIAS